MEINSDENGVWEDGAVLIESEDGFWDGDSAFIENWKAAKKFRPCRPDYKVGIVEAESNTGNRCWPVYVMPPER